MFCEKCGKELSSADKFCAGCGNSLTQPTTPSNILINPKTKSSYRKKAWLWGLGPLFVFIVTIIFWGVLNIYTESGGETDITTFITNIVLPFIFGITFLAFPLGIVLAIYYGNKAGN